MRTKKSFSFDEEKDAERIYNNGFPDNKIDYGQMYLIAKFIRQTFDYGEIRLEREVIRFCQKQDKNFNPIVERDAIKKWIRSALNYDLRKIDSVSVSQKEINIIKQIGSTRHKKVLFVALVFSKALKKGSVKRDKTNLKTSDHYYIHYNNFTDIIRLARLNNMSEVDLADIFYEHNKLFTFYKAERELIRLEFVDKNPKKPIIISDLNNIMNFYNILFENKRMEADCEICGEKFTKNSNRQRVCNNCSKVLNRRRVSKFRNKNISL
jgi:hypothetical protein